MSAETVGTAEYGLPNSWRDARRRLALIGECLDGLAARRLDAIGVAPGWHCLEVGGGGGSVAALLAERAGPTGHVVATDIDTSFLDERKGPHLEVWHHDITADDLPGGAFDLVHTRSVLLHLPERDRVIGKLVSALRPGGWLLFEETDMYPVEATAPEPYRGAWAAVGEALPGMARHWARHLPALLCDLGLGSVAADTEVALFPGGSPMAELMQLTFVQARPAVPGGDQGVIDAAVEALGDERQWFPGPAVIGVRAQRPG